MGIGLGSITTAFSLRARGNPINPVRIPVAVALLGAIPITAILKLWRASSGVSLVHVDRSIIRKVHFGSHYVRLLTLGYSVWPSMAHAMVSRACGPSLFRPEGI